MKSVIFDVPELVNYTRMLRTLTTLGFALLSMLLIAQMPTPAGGVNYGNEWIDYSQDYLRVSVAEDGMYRITSAQLAAGLDLAITPQNADKWTLYHQGTPVPIEVTEEGIVFYGEQNRGAMDRFLFEDPDLMQLNDRYSMHTDSSAYFLTVKPTVGGPFYAPPAITGIPIERTEILRQSEVVFGDFQSKYYVRTSDGNSIYLSHYEPTEGFGSRSTNDLLSSNGSTETLVSLPLPAANGTTATLALRFGVAFRRHEQAISIDGVDITNVEANAWQVKQTELEFTPSGATAAVRLQGLLGEQDKANVAWARATYPAALTYDNDLQAFTVPTARTATRLTFTGAAAGALIAYNNKGRVAVPADVNGSEATFTFPAAGGDATFQLVANGAYLSPSTAKHRFTPTLPADGRTNYLILTSRRLHGSAVEELAEYRRSVTGGSHRVHIIDVEDLYEEFAYGIRRHPIAVRNYLALARSQFPDLQYLFLIGKGREYDDIRTPEQLTQANATYFIPSFGLPASDNLLSADLGTVVPRFATGRLAAINNEEVAIYLQKLRDVEAQVNRGDQGLEDREWMKQIMHLGGGTRPTEQSQIRNNLSSFEQIIEPSTMGAEVTSFYKTSSEPIEDSRQDAIFERINAGTAIITFYGHSSSQGFDFSIDDPNNYFNKDKYPYMLSLGCYSGDAFTEARSISERFIFLRDKGAIAFAASKGIGYIHSLSTWADGLYDLMGNEYYGQGIGDAMRANIEDFSTSSSLFLNILLEQFSLSGDPAYHPRTVLAPTCE